MYSAAGGNSRLWNLWKGKEGCVNMNGLNSRKELWYWKSQLEI